MRKTFPIEVGQTVYIGVSNPKASCLPNREMLIGAIEKIGRQYFYVRYNISLEPLRFRKNDFQYMPLPVNPYGKTFCLYGPEQEAERELQELSSHIVREYLHDMNPELWDGEGAPPSSFISNVWECPLDSYVHLEVACARDEENAWRHYIDLVYESSNDSFACVSCVGLYNLEYEIEKIIKKNYSNILEDWFYE